MTDLAKKRCVPCEGGTPPLDRAKAQELHKLLRNEWKLNEDGKSIQATFTFKNYYQTTAFVNAIAWMAHREDHHPDISFGYKTCTVFYSTHAAGGLTENDFICAAKVDELLR
jgi:4a-hydroxytetrahydrobiopterin dehydratase